MSLPAIAVSLLAAAAAQDLAPATQGLGVKAPFLTAAALYYALTRPAVMALTALVWAGLLTDALGGLPLYCTLSLLLPAYWLVRALHRVFLEATLVQGALLAACAAVAQTIWTRAWVGGPEPLFAWRTLEALGAAAPAGLIAGLVGFAVCGQVDRFSGVVKPVKEGNGILWAETDR